MRDVINQSMIWKIVGGVSTINGLVCFGLSSTYDISFGKLGFGGHLVYLLLCLTMWCLMLRAKRILVSEKVQGVLAALIFVVICSISVLFDKVTTGKSDDVLSIISYGSFALMSVSMSRKFELGFETGFSTFFLQLFAAQLFKIRWFLLPIALVFCSLVIILRHYCSESRVQSGPITPNGYHPVEVGPPNAAVIDIVEEDINENQDSAEMGEVSGQRLSSTNNEQNSQEESSQAVGEVSEENISDGGNELNSEQEEDSASFLTAESSYSWEQDHVSTGNYQNGWMHSSPPPQLLRRRRMRMTPVIENISGRMRMTPVIQNISSSLGATLRRWHPTHLLLFIKWVATWVYVWGATWVYSLRVFISQVIMDKFRRKTYQIGANKRRMALPL